MLQTINKAQLSSVDAVFLLFGFVTSSSSIGRYSLSVLSFSRHVEGTQKGSFVSLPRKSLHMVSQQIVSRESDLTARAHLYML